jgi:hypothetical protein
MRGFLLMLLMAIPCFADSPFQTKVSVTPVSAITAASASIEQLSDRVAVFLNDEDPVRKFGIRIAVKSDAKFVAVRSTLVGSGRPVSVNRFASGDWILFGDPGQYVITVIESDPEKGIHFTDLESEIAGSKPPPPKPIEPGKPVTPPPTYDRLFQVASTTARQLNDPDTAILLASAYRQSLLKIGSDTTIDDAKQIVVEGRREAFRNRKSFAVNWAAFLTAIDPEISRIGVDVTSYRKAIQTVVDALDASRSRSGE